ncbi:MAG: ABC transporter substrate-binding protein [Nocardioides sp.]
MRNPSMRRTFAGAAILALTTMGLAACGGDGGSGADDKTVTILSSVDQPVQDGLEETLTAKLKADGYTVDWQKVDAIDQLIMTRIQGNQLPDIALIPQPGVVRNVVNRAGGKAVDLSTLVDKATLEKTMVPGTLDAGTIDGKLYGLLVSMNVKGLVFYPKKAFEKAGYEVPETIGDLEALTEQIKSDGGTPWCAGIESEAATGWPATDWFEILVAKYGGVDTYNSWVAGETKFDSEVVRQAAGEFEKLAVHRRERARWSQGHRHHELPDRWYADVRRQAGLLDVQPGLVHHRLLPQGRAEQPGRRGRRLRLPACFRRWREPLARRWRPADGLQRQRRHQGCCDGAQRA